MFGWLKRKTQLAMIRSMDEDIERFIISLRGADEERFGMVVAMADSSLIYYSSSPPRSKKKKDSLHTNQ